MMESEKGGQSNMGETTEMGIPELEVDITGDVSKNHEENVSEKPLFQDELKNSISHILDEEKDAEVSDGNAKPENEGVQHTGKEKPAGCQESDTVLRDTDKEEQDKLGRLQDQVGDISIMLQSVTRSIDQLKMQVQSVDSANRQLAEEARRSLNSVLQVNDRLHIENQKLKDDMYSQMLKPVLMGLCQVANNINKDIKKENDEKVKGKLLDIRDDVIGVCMSNLGVEVYEPKIGEDFDELRHRLVKSIATEDEKEHRKIQEVLGQGYLWRKNSEMIILEPCKVNVYNVNYRKS